MSAELPAALGGEVLRERRFAFRIDEGRAFEKLRAYRVAEPERYVLEIVLAAIAGGASWVEVEPGAWATRIRFDGPPFVESELKRVYHHLIEEGEGGTTRLAHLASALVMLSHLRLRSVEIISGSVRLTETFVDDAEPVRELETLDAPSAHTGITIRRRRALKLLQVLGLRAAAEAEVLAERALLCPITIRVDGEELASRLPDHYVSVALDGRNPHGVRGTVGLGRDYSHDHRLHLCYRGVLVESVRRQGLGGVVSSPHFRRNLSFNDILEGDALTQALAAASRHRKELERALVGRLLTELAPPAAAIDPIVRRLGLRQLTTGRMEPAVREALLALPLLERVDKQPCTIGQLLDELEAAEPGADPWGERQRLLYVKRGFAHPSATVQQLDGQTLVLMPDRGGAVKALIQQHFADATSRLRRAHAEQRYMRKPVESTVVMGTTGPRLSFDEPGLRGELGFGSDLHKSEIRLLWRDRPLGRVPEDLTPGLRGVVAVSELRPTARFDRAQKNEAFRAAVARIMAQHTRLVGTLVDSAPQVLAQGAPADARALLSARLLWNLVLGDHDAEWRPRALRLPLLATLEAGTRTSVEHVVQRSEQGWIPWLDGSDPTLVERSRQIVVGLCEPAAIVVLPDPLSAELLEQLLASPGRDLEPELRAAAKRLVPSRWRSDVAVQDRWPHMRRGPTHKFSRGVIRGVVGRSVGGSAGSPRGVMYLRGGYPITQSGAEDVRWLCPAIAAAVDSPDMPVNLGHSSIRRKDPRYAAVRDAVAEAAEALVCATPEGDVLRLAYLAYHYEVARGGRPPALRIRKRLVSLTGAGLPARLDSKRRLPPDELLEAPLLHDVSGRPWSLRTLADAAQRQGALGYALGSPTPPSTTSSREQDEVIVRLPGEEELYYASLLFPLVDRSREVALLAHRERLAELSSEEEAVLGDSYRGRRRRIDRSGTSLGRLRGEIGFGPPDGVRLLFRGVVAHASFAPELPWATLCGVLDFDELPVSMSAAEGDALLSDHALDTLRAIVAGEAALHLSRWCAEAPEEGDPGRRVQRYLTAMLTDSAFLERVRAGLARPSQEPALASMLTIPFVRARRGRPLSLRALSDRAQQGPIPFVPWGPGPDLPESAPAPDPLLVLAPDELRLLAGILGEDALVDAKAAHDHDAARSRFLDRCQPAELDAAPDAALVSQRVRQDISGVPYHGVAWIPGPDVAAATHRGGLLIVCVDGRKVARLPVDVGGFAFVCAVTSPGFTIDELGTGSSAARPRIGGVEDAFTIAKATARTLQRRLLREARAGRLTPEAAAAARCIALTHGIRQYHRHQHAAFSLYEAVFESPLFRRADGHGRVSLRALIEDFEADGEIGYLGATVPPEHLGRDLGVVVTHPVEHRLFRSLFGEGWVDYRGREAPPTPVLVQPAPPATAAPAAALEQLRWELDKCARCLQDTGPRELVARWSASLCFATAGAAAPWLHTDAAALVLNRDHPRVRRLARRVEAGADVAAPVAAALAAHLLAEDPSARLALLVALATAD